MECTLKGYTIIMLAAGFLLLGAPRAAQASRAAKNTAAIYVPCQKQVRAASAACLAQARAAAQSAVQRRLATRACSKATKQRLAVCKLRAKTGGYAGIVTNAHFGAASW